MLVGRWSYLPSGFFCYRHANKALNCSIGDNGSSSLFSRSLAQRVTAAITTPVRLGAANHAQMRAYAGQPPRVQKGKDQVIP